MMKFVIKFRLSRHCQRVVGLTGRQTYSQRQAGETHHTRYFPAHLGPALCLRGGEQGGLVDHVPV